VFGNSERDGSRMNVRFAPGSGHFASQDIARTNRNKLGNHKRTSWLRLVAVLRWQNSPWSFRRYFTVTQVQAARWLTL
jgi:hypothetical protein